MAGARPARRRRRLALVPCSLREVALNFMKFSELAEHSAGDAPPQMRRRGCGGRDQPPQKNLDVYSTDSEDTDSACEMRSMASPSIAAQDNWRMPPHAPPSSLSGMLSGAARLTSALSRN